MSKSKFKLLGALTIALTVALCGLFGACAKDDADKAYTVTLPEAVGGAVYADVTSAKKGETVTLTVEPEFGYELESLSANTVALTVQNYEVSFLMPSSNVKVEAAFKKLPDDVGDELEIPLESVSEDLPQTYAFELSAHSAYGKAESYWSYAFGNDGIEFNVWVRDAKIFQSKDAVRLYFGKPAYSYDLSSELSVEIKLDNTVKSYRVTNGAFTAAQVTGVSGGVKLWQEGGAQVGYKATVSVAYSALGIEQAAAKNGVTFLPELVNGGSASVPAVNANFGKGFNVLKPYTYVIMTNDNEYTANPYFNGRGQLGDSNIAASTGWDLSKDYFAEDENYADRKAVLNTINRDNDVFFFNTIGGEKMFVEATFKITDVRNGERWGKFGLMFFDGRSQSGVFFYVDAFNNSGAVSVGNLAGTALGYNKAASGWGAWNGIGGTNGSFDLSDKTITLKMAYSGGKIYMYNGDELVDIVNYAPLNPSEVCIGIKSFNFTMEVSDYYSTANLSDDKLVAAVNPNADFNDAATLKGNAALNQSANGTRYTVYTFDKAVNLTAVPATAKIDILSNNDCLLTVNGEAVNAERSVLADGGNTRYTYDVKSLLATGNNQIKVYTMNVATTFKLRAELGATVVLSDTTWISGSQNLEYQTAPKYNFLGSSVTFGSATGGISFADKFRTITGFNVEKQAVSGTTLADSASKTDSYVDRIANFSTTQTVEKLIVQLSTNDATNNIAMGTLSNTATTAALTEFGGTQTYTVMGAIEYIVAYAKYTWGCDVVFYTNPYYSNTKYEAMITALEQIQDKWNADSAVNVEIIDFYNYKNTTALTSATLESYKSDSIHPNSIGYDWMSNVFTDYLVKQLILAQ